jgi:hypothetical protein
MTQTKSKALVYAEEVYFSHDISHCNPDQITGKCYECKRYAAHLQLTMQANQDRFRDGLYSYFSAPNESCIEKDFKLFSQLD